MSSDEAPLVVDDWTEQPQDKQDKQEHLIQDKSMNTHDIQQKNTHNIHDKITRAGWLSFHVLGVAMLFPWNAFINADGYFHARLRGSSYEAYFSSAYALCFMIATMIAMIIGILRPSLRPAARIVASLVTALGVLIVCAVLTLVPLPPLACFLLHLALVFVCGIAVALLQNGVFAIAAHLPPRYTQAIMSGQGLAGAAVSIAQMLSLLANGPPVENPQLSDLATAALIYFSVACVVILLGLLAFFFLSRSSLYHQHILPASHHQDANGYTPIVQEEGNDSDDDEEEVSMTSTVIDKTTCTLPVRYGRILHTLAPCAVSVFLTFVVTLSVYPSITSLVRANTESNARLFTDMFVPFGFLLFALGDWLGKSVPGLPRWWCTRGDDPSYVTLVVSLMRVVFIPFFMGCRLSVATQRYLVVTNDWVFWMGMVVFAVSNGWAGTTSLIAGSARMAAKSHNNQAETSEEEAERERQERQVAGTVMVFLLTLGLSVGSAASFGIRQAAVGPKP